MPGAPDVMDYAWYLAISGWPATANEPIGCAVDWVPV